MPEARSHEFFWVVPLRRVFPWWYLLGVVVTAGVPIVLGLSTAGGVALWGPVIGLAIQDRWRRAASRRDAGLSVNRRDLVGKPWEEPVFAALWTLVAVGLQFVLGFVFGGVPTFLRWTGAGLVIGAAIAGLAIVLRAGRPGRGETAE